MIRITSKRDGFRRCGVTHRGTVDYPNDRFTFGELETLAAEPMLTVTVIEETPAEAPPDGTGAVTGDGSGEALPPADDTEKTGPATAAIIKKKGKAGK